MTNVFISWSGNKSKEIAQELHTWIPSVLQFAKPYFTPNDIEKGAKWGDEISRKLSESNVGIICLTKENFNKPWILFEAGALSKDLEKSKVCSILFGMENPDLSGPLTTFQTTEFSKADFRKLMYTINKAGEGQGLADETFERVFDKWWPDFETKINSILSSEPEESAENVRPDRDILEEILMLLRRSSRDPTTRVPRIPIPRKLVLDLIEAMEKIHNVNESELSVDINDALKDCNKIAEYLLRKTGATDDELEQRLTSQKAKLDDLLPF